MTFRILGLDPAPYMHLWHADEASLAAVGVHRMCADSTPGFPDRITLDDAPIGRDVLLLNHVSQTANTPFRASHAIYLLEGAETPFDATDQIPPAMCRRPQSLRAFDSQGMLRSADLAEEEDAIADKIEVMFQDLAINEIHAHNARQGCFMARILRG